MSDAETRAGRGPCPAGNSRYEAASEGKRRGGSKRRSDWGAPIVCVAPPLDKMGLFWLLRGMPNHCTPSLNCARAAKFHIQLWQN